VPATEFYHFADVKVGDKVEVKVLGVEEGTGKLP
jgi:predicted RNA-binding protein with RPS1 domain